MQRLRLAAALERALRRGMKSAVRVDREPYGCPAYAMGYPPRADLDRTLDLAAALDDQEVGRKIVLCK